MDLISNVTTPPSLLGSSSTVSSKEKGPDRVGKFVRGKLESKASKEALRGKENRPPAAAIPMQSIDAMDQSNRVDILEAIENFQSKKLEKRKHGYVELLHFLEAGGYDLRIFQAATLNILRGGELCQTGIGFYKDLLAKGKGVEEGAKVAAFLVESDDAPQIREGCDLFIELLKQDTKPVKINLMGPPCSEEEVAILSWLKLALELAKRQEASEELEKAVRLYLSHESTEVCKRAYEFFQITRSDADGSEDEVWI